VYICEATFGHLAVCELFAICVDHCMISNRHLSFLYLEHFSKQAVVHNPLPPLDNIISYDDCLEDNREDLCCVLCNTIVHNHTPVISSFYG